MRKVMNAVNGGLTSSQLSENRQCHLTTIYSTLNSLVTDTISS